MSWILILNLNTFHFVHDILVKFIFKKKSYTAKVIRSISNCPNESILKVITKNFFCLLIQQRKEILYFTCRE